MKNFLVPTDLSANAFKSLDFITDLNKKAGGKITLVHAFRMPQSDPLGMAQASYSQKDIFPQLQESKEKQLEETIEFYSKEHPGFEWDYIAQLGFPAEVILKAAEELKPEAIVMGPSGILGIFKAFKGNISSRVIEKAQCPVIVVPENYVQGPFQKMIYATDLEKEHDRKIRKMKAFSVDYGVEITLLHIFEMDLVRKDDLQNKYRELLEKDHELGNLHLEIINDPDIVHGLLKAIDKEKVDLVAMVRSQRSVLEKLFEKSTTMQMTRQTKVPLIIYHE